MSPVMNTQNADIIPAINPLNMDSFSVLGHYDVDHHPMLNPKVGNPSEPKLVIVCRSDTVGALPECGRRQTDLG